MFSNLNFKYTDAEEEKIHAPELIESAYVDINNILEKIQRPEKFLVIGPKGAGKTALSSKLQLIGKKTWNVFVDDDELEQFEFNLLDKSGGEKGQSIGGAITVWQLLLSIRFLPLFLSDEKLKELNPKLDKFNNALQKYGLTSSESLINIVQYTSRRGIFSNLKSAISEVKAEKSEEENFKIKDPAAIFESIKEVFNDINPSDSNYYLVLDGLDHPIRKGRRNAPYIADLINASRYLNNYFQSLKVNAKVIILLRDEVLQIVPDPNLTKRVVDNGVALTWFENVRSPLETSLLRIVENRANLVGLDLKIEKLWKRWFPSQINKSASYNFVLKNTRYLPRDLISFFRELQELQKEPPFTREDVLAALNNYSDWFLQELSDALVGLIKEEIRTELPDILSDLGREFFLSDFKTKISEYDIPLDSSPEQILRELFNTSWLGNSWKTDQDSDRYSWKHRKRSSKINLKKKIIVHPGLWKALNLV